MAPLILSALVRFPRALMTRGIRRRPRRRERRTNLLRACPQNLPRQVARMMPVLVEHVAVDDGVFDALRRHHEPAAAAGQIVLHARALGRAYLALVEDRDVGGQPDLEPAAILDSEEVRRLRRDSLDCVL